MDAKKMEERQNDGSYEAAGKSMNTLRRFLCDRVRMNKEPADVVMLCKACESQCAYGREYGKRYDAGERPVKMGPKPKPDDLPCEKPAPAANERMAELEAQLKAALENVQLKEKLLAEADAEMMSMDKALKCQEAEALKLRKELVAMQERGNSLAEVLGEQEALNEELRTTITGLSERNIKSMQEAEEARGALVDAEAQRKADKLVIIRLKARLWDMEHPEED